VKRSCNGRSALAENKDTQACGSRKKKRVDKLVCSRPPVSLVLRTYPWERLLRFCKDSFAGLSKRGLQFVFTAHSME
jgi:hypothetical protein